MILISSPYILSETIFSTCEWTSTHHQDEAKKWFYVVTVGLWKLLADDKSQAMFLIHLIDSFSSLDAESDGRTPKLPTACVTEDFWVSVDQFWILRRPRLCWQELWQASVTI